MCKTIPEINEKIRRGRVTVVRADEMCRIVDEIGAEKAAEKVDVVTTGTFGAMCSSGVFMNFGHSDPPIKMGKIHLNGVQAYGGLAAVDTYLGATQPSMSQDPSYGGAHVIEDLLKGNTVELSAESNGTDCYPLQHLRTSLTLNDLNQAILCNPRNAYQTYNAATNSTTRAIFTYMGKLLPRFGNVTYSGAGELSPLNNDPTFRTIGLGTRIFLGGGIGYVIGSGTQHDPGNGFGTLRVQGDLKQMSAEFIRAASFAQYGPSLYVGIGIPIPVLNVDVARAAGVSDGQIFTSVIDYGVPRLNRPTVRRVSYAELTSGLVEIAGRPVAATSLSSRTMAERVADALKEKICRGRMELTAPVDTLSSQEALRPLVRRDMPPEVTQPSPPGSGTGWHSERCIHCGLCTAYCPRGVFVRSASGLMSADFTRCTRCGECDAVCPVGTIHHG